MLLPKDRKYLEECAEKSLPLLLSSCITKLLKEYDKLVKENEELKVKCQNNS